ncbi:hypothetical protein, partial [Pectobacterium carotovorum]|uniref:hypothetical protein n=1 Tax=Pectobacterium carotovorum TaxID=554 RepID=UPI0021C38467
RSADGSVGLPHVRVGNCQASNKWKAPVGRQGLFAMCYLGVREEDKTVRKTNYESLYPNP